MDERITKVKTVLSLAGFGVQILAAAMKKCAEALDDLVESFKGLVAYLDHEDDEAEDE